jgi:hypothetical protein
MILVHLREPLHRVVLFDGLRDLPELLDCFPLQVVIRVSHGLLHLKTISIASAAIDRTISLDMNTDFLTTCPRAPVCALPSRQEPAPAAASRPVTVTI